MATVEQLPPPDVLEEELELLLDDELELLELELLEELLLDEELLEEEPPPTTPYGAGWDSQVLREIQLWLFSQPQPLCVFRHKG